MIRFLKRLWARAFARPQVSCQISADVLDGQSAGDLLRQINESVAASAPPSCPTCRCPGHIDTAELFRVISEEMRRGHVIRGCDWHE